LASTAISSFDRQSQQPDDISLGRVIRAEHLLQLHSRTYGALPGK
jgi:hypothetical protein